MKQLANSLRLPISICLDYWFPLYSYHFVMKKYGNLNISAQKEINDTTNTIACHLVKLMGRLRTELLSHY